jgi:hypothetical protein
MVSPSHIRPFDLLGKASLFFIRISDLYFIKCGPNRLNYLLRIKNVFSVKHLFININELVEIRLG